MSLILPDRRKLLTGVAALGVGALVRPGPARANLLSMTSQQLFNPRVFRQPGRLMAIDWTHPLAKDLMVYMIDLGNGVVVDLARGYNINSGSAVIPNISYPFGGGLNWPGTGGATLSFGKYIKVGFVLQSTGGIDEIDPESQISVASNLASLPTGAGFTFGATFYLTDPGYNEQFIFGRPAHGQEIAPFANWSLQARNAGDGGVGIALFYNNNGTLNQCGGGATIGANNVPYTVNTLYTAAGVFKNTAAGVSTVQQYQNGVLENTSTGAVITGTNQTNELDGETQLMLGSIYHVDTTQAFQCCQGWPGIGVMWSGPKTAQEMAQWWLGSPLQILKPVEGEMPDMAQAASTGAVVPFSFLPPFGVGQ